jgi:hypothetical protein
VRGGKNGDTWVNTSGGNQVNIWGAGVWTPVTWTASSVIAASSITASLIAAGTIIAGAVDGTTITGATLIADGSSGEILVYSGTPATGNLIGSWSGAAGTDGHSNSYPAGLAVETGGMVLLNQGSAPATVTGGSTLYTSSSGRLRYLSNSGADLVLDRSKLDDTNVSMTTSASPVIMSRTLSYLGGEAQVASEYEIEIDGTITTPGSTPQAFTFDLFVDGAAVGSASSFTLGTSMLAAGITQGYCVRYRLTVDSTGAGGKCTVAADGGTARLAVNLGNTATTSAINVIQVNLAFDTTSNHSLAIYCHWGVAPGSGSAITYRTKLTRRN